MIVLDRRPAQKHRSSNDWQYTHQLSQSMAAIIDRLNSIARDLKALNSVMCDISFSGKDLETLEAVAANLKDTTGNLIENGPRKTPRGLRRHGEKDGICQGIDSQPLCRGLCPSLGHCKCANWSTTYGDLLT